MGTKKDWIFFVCVCVCISLFCIRKNHKMKIDQFDISGISFSSRRSFDDQVPEWKRKRDHKLYRLLGKYSHNPGMERFGKCEIVNTMCGSSYYVPKAWVPIKHPVVEYTFWGNSSGHNEFKPEKSSWKWPEKITMGVLMSILHTAGVRDEMFSGTMATKSVTAEVCVNDLYEPMKRAYSNILIIMEQQKLTKQTDSNSVDDIQKDGDDEDDDHGLGQSKLIVLLIGCVKEIAFFCHSDSNGSDERPLYRLSEVVNKKPHIIKQAYELCNSDPDGAFYLCFSKLTDGFPELAFEKYMTLWNGNDFQKTCVEIYCYVKEMSWEKRMCYVLPSDIFDKFKGKEKELDHLVANKLLIWRKPAPDDVILPIIDKWEYMLVSALKQIWKNGEDWKELLEDVPNVEDLRTGADHPLCDEQKAAFHKFLAKPINYIVGPGGSGKTDFLRSINGMKNIDGVLAVACYGTNVKMLLKTFPGRSRTIHWVIGHHNRHCPKSPSARAKMKRFPKYKPSCIFQDVNVIVIDEAFVAPLGVLAHFLYSASQCGKVRRLIMVGDPNQLPPIEIGQPALTLLPTYDAMGCVSRFQHNHRVEVGADRLIETANAIKDGKFDDVKWEKNVIHIDCYSRSGLEELLQVLQNESIPETECGIMAAVHTVINMLMPAVEEYYSKMDKPPTTPHRSRISLNRVFSPSKNDYEFNICNNERFKLTKIIDYNKARSADYRDIMSVTDDFSYGGATLRCLVAKSLDDGTVINILYDRDRRRILRKASVTTVHAFQGNQTKVAILVLPYLAMNVNRQMLYTWATRASEKIIFIGSLSVFSGAVRREPSVPVSNLDQMLFI